MNDYTTFFKDKKVTVMGLGLLGRGVGDAALIAEAGAAEVIVTDLKTKEQLAESMEKLSQYKNITFVLGEHRLEDFDPLAGIDFVLVAAGVPLDSEFLQHAREAGIPLKQSAALFAELSNIPIIGVTGTRGKTTVTNMIHHVLEQVTGEKVILGGNIRGVSNLQLLKDVKEDSLCVMELDSWQLQGWGWVQRSPQIAVFTSFMEDHLDYYLKNGKNRDEAMQQYFEDKANIFKYQKEGDVFITTPEVFEQSKTLPGTSIGQEVILADASVIPEDAVLAMPGEHNRLNAALAHEALKALSLTEEEIGPALATFSGVEGRLQLIGEVDDVKIYNDNNATTPQATIAGIEAVGNADDKDVVLIIGGTNKNINLDTLVETIEKYCKHVVLYSGSGTEKLKELLPDGVSSEEYEMLEDCVKAAHKAAQPGDVMLFSPAFSSFGKYYKNEYDRNDQFVEFVLKLKK